MKKLTTKARIAASRWETTLQAENIRLLSYSPTPNSRSASLEIECLTCGTIEKNVTSNLRRRKDYCRVCGGCPGYSTEQIVSLIQEDGGTYISGHVRNSRSLVHLTCSHCNRRIKKKASNIRRSGARCEKCKGERISATRRSRSNTLARARKVAKKRGGRCLTETATVTTTEHLDWECSLGHRWKAVLPSVEFSGTWCPHCSGSITERFVRALIESAYGHQFPRSHPKFLPGLELDGLNLTLRVAFEVDGKQHFEKNPFYHRSDQDFERQRSNDQTKRKLCAENDIFLVTVPYWISDQGWDQVRRHIDRQLKSCPSQPKRSILSVYVDERLVYDTTKDVKFKRFDHTIRQNQAHYDKSDYAGYTSHLEITCKKGHKFRTRPDLVLRGSWCQKCQGNYCRTKDQLDRDLQMHGWRLRHRNFLYRNAHHDLPLLCPNGHHVDRPWNKWQGQRDKGHLRCQQCRVAEYARQFIYRMARRGIEVMVTVEQYKNGDQAVAGRCLACGATTIISVNKWKTRSRAPCCGTFIGPFHAQVMFGSNDSNR